MARLNAGSAELNWFSVVPAFGRFRPFVGYKQERPFVGAVHDVVWHSSRHRRLPNDATDSLTEGPTDACS
jgi:hypothetical protein